MSQIWKVDTTITSVQGGPGYSQLYFEKLPTLDASTACERVRNYWNSFKSYTADSVVAQVSNEVTVIEVETGQVLEVVTVDALDPVAGTDEGQLLPFATQGLGRFTTGQYVAGRQLRGRMFIPGFTESNSDGGQPTNALQAQMADSLAALATGALSCVPVVYSRTHHVSAPMTGASFWNQWAVLRSRRD